MAVDSVQFRRVMGTFATGVSVVTIPLPTGAWGMTANSLTSVSLAPALVLVCVDKSTRTHRYMLDSEVWAINVLAADQESTSQAFAASEDDESRRMIGTVYQLSRYGAPLIDGCLSHIDCRAWARYDGGDHTIFLGEVQDAVVCQPEKQPLLYYGGRYARIQPGLP